MFKSDLGVMPIDPPVRSPVVNGERMKRGRRPGEPSVGFSSVAKDWQWPTIPRSRWMEAIEHKEKTRTRLIDLCDHHGLTVLNQGQTNYCWINAPVHCLEITRMANNLDLVRLSPASVGAKIKNFRNVGGWGSEGLEYMVSHGVVPQRDWPANAIDRRYDTAANDEIRDSYKVTEWTALQPRNFEQLATCLLLGMPVAVGYNWWGHEVTAMDLVAVEGGGYGIIIHNSWGPNWGDRGRGVLTERSRKALPDDAVVCRVATGA